MRWELAFALTVHGEAAPQGSKTVRAIGGGKSVVREANPKTKPWRKHVSDAAGELWQGRPLLDGPLRMVLYFYRVRPPSHFKLNGELSAAGRRQPLPATAPDSSKLLRAIEDSLNKVVIVDDARIVSHAVEKCWGDSERTEIQVFVLRDRGDGRIW